MTFIAAEPRSLSNCLEYQVAGMCSQFKYPRGLWHYHRMSPFNGMQNIPGTEGHNVNVTGLLMFTCPVVAIVVCGRQLPVSPLQWSSCGGTFQNHCVNVYLRGINQAICSTVKIIDKKKAISTKQKRW